MFKQSISTSGMPIFFSCCVVYFLITGCWCIYLATLYTSKTPTVMLFTILIWYKPVHNFICTITLHRERRVFNSRSMNNVLRRWSTLFLSTWILHAHSMRFTRGLIRRLMRPLVSSNTAGLSPQPATHIIIINFSCQINAEITFTLAI